MGRPRRYVATSSAYDDPRRRRRHGDACLKPREHLHPPYDRVFACMRSTTNLSTSISPATSNQAHAPVRAVTTPTFDGPAQDASIQLSPASSPTSRSTDRVVLSVPTRIARPPTTARPAPIPATAGGLWTKRWSCHGRCFLRGLPPPADGDWSRGWCGGHAIRGHAEWTSVHYLSSTTHTNNTAEYIALLDRLRGALHHGVRCLTIKGGSTLILERVRGCCAYNNARLRKLRNQVHGLLRRLESYELVHIDRLMNQDAARLANRALEGIRTRTECTTHYTNGEGCG